MTKKKECKKCKTLSDDFKKKAEYWKKWSEEYKKLSEDFKTGKRCKK